MTDLAAAPRRPKYTRQQLLARIAIGVSIVFILLMWIYFFVFADKRPAAKVDDTAWTERAEQICTRRNELIDENAAAFRAGDDYGPQSLGKSVARTTDLIEDALDEMLAVPPASATDQKIVGEWADLYRIYIGDRRDAEAKLAAGEQAELNETTFNGSPVSLTIADFAKPNRMPACEVPQGG